MKQRGRKSSAALSTPSVDGTPARLRPPPELPENVRKSFVELVSSTVPGHFQPSDRPLLVAYARAIALEQAAGAALAADPTDGKALLLWEKSGRQMTALSMRLRLSPQARRPTGAKSPTTPLSYYEFRELERANGS